MGTPLKEWGTGRYRVIFFRHLPRGADVVTECPRYEEADFGATTSPEAGRPRKRVN